MKEIMDKVQCDWFCSIKLKSIHIKNVIILSFEFSLLKSSVSLDE